MNIYFRILITKGVILNHQIEKNIFVQYSDNIDQILNSNLSLKRKIRILSKLTLNSMNSSAIQAYIFNNSPCPITQNDDKEILLILYRQKEIAKINEKRALKLKDLLIPNQKEMEIEELQKSNRTQNQKISEYEQEIKQTHEIIKKQEEEKQLLEQLIKTTSQE